MSQPDLLRHGGTRLASSSRSYLSRKAPCLPRATQRQPPCLPVPLAEKTHFAICRNTDLLACRARHARSDLARTSPPTADMMCSAFGGGETYKRCVLSFMCFSLCWCIMSVCENFICCSRANWANRPRLSRPFIPYTPYEHISTVTGVARDVCNRKCPRQTLSEYAS